MTAPTHISFAMFCYFIALAATQGTMSLFGIGILSFGALLPDIDTPKSFLGRIFFFISPKIEAKFHHRTITHSVLFIGFVYLAAALILQKLPNQKYLLTPLMIGVISHIVLDTINKEGPQLLYPSSLKCVFPGKRQFRIEVGSKSEWVFFFIVSGFVILSYPIAQRGLIKTLHYFMSDIQSAVVDYQEYSLTHEVFAQISAADNLTNKRTDGRFKVVGFQGKNILIIEYDKTGKLKTIGDYEDNNLRPMKIRITKGEKLNYIVEQIELKYCQINKLQEYLNENYDQQIFGTIEPLEKVNIFESPEYYNAVKMKGGNITLAHAKYKDLKEHNLTEIYVKKAQIMIKTALKQNQAYNPKLKIIDKQNIKNEFVNKFEVAITVEDKAEILVKKDDIIQKGQLIAHITRNEDKVKIKDTEIEGYQKELEDIQNDTALYAKETKLKTLNFQLESIDKELAEKKEEKKQEIAKLKNQIKIMQEEQKYNQKKYNALNVFKIKTELETKEKELGQLEANIDVIPNDIKFKIYTIKDELTITEREIEQLKSKKQQDIERIERKIVRAELEKADLLNRSDIKSPVSGLVANIDFTMSIEYLTRVNITILERNG